MIIIYNNETSHVSCTFHGMVFWKVINIQDQFYI